jgi:serine/threonine protein kinase
MPRACPSCLSIYSSNEEFCVLDGTRLVADNLAHRTIGRYRIIEHLGSGTMGAVFRAHDPERHTDVALKVLKDDPSAKVPRKRRFIREARIARDLHHPNIVSVYDSSSDGHVMFIAMELLRGVTLERVLAKETTLSVQRSAHIASQIARGLFAAHGLGFVHRDLKPANVMLMAGPAADFVKILDFGVAGAHDDALELTRLTADGATVGSPAYMAPEQIASASVGPEADLYALGVMLYEMLSGSVPFTGSVTEVVLKRLSEPPKPLPDLGGIEKLVARLLERAPENRPRNAEEVARELDVFVGGPDSGPIVPRPFESSDLHDRVTVHVNVASISAESEDITVDDRLDFDEQTARKSADLEHDATVDIVKEPRASHDLVSERLSAGAVAPGDTASRDQAVVIPRGRSLGDEMAPIQRPRLSIAVLLLASTALLSTALLVAVLSKDEPLEVPAVSTERAIDRDRDPLPAPVDPEIERGPREEPMTAAEPKPEPPRPLAEAHEQSGRAKKAAPARPGKAPASPAGQAPAVEDARNALKAKLRDDFDELTKLRGREPDARLEPLWREYLEIDTAFRQNLSAPQYEALRAQAIELERKLAKVEARTAH